MRARAHLIQAVAVVAALTVVSDRPRASAAAVDDASLAALWQDPGDVRAGDLFNGPWGAACAPDPHATYAFVRSKQHGVNPGIVVRDPLGRTWHVKQAPHGDIGEEGPVEVALSRVLSAVGYRQPPVYFLRSFTMANGAETRKTAGGRFRLDEPSMHHRGTWSWQDNPLAGTRPHQGLLVILLMFNSWDLKDANNALYEVRRDHRNEEWYVVRDLGGALGESGHLRPKRNDVALFERQTFIKGVADGFVTFAYRGKQSDLVRHRITVDDVRWASDLLGRLTDRQWHDAFRAGGYPPDTSDRFIRKIRANILQGQQLSGMPASARER